MCLKDLNALVQLDVLKKGSVIFYIGRASEKAGSRVTEPACFGAAPAPGIFYPEPAPTPVPAPAPGKREQNVGIF